jgi:drug/metabolite transporter (DMT)-like permease
MVVLAGLLEPGVSYPLINAGLARSSGTHGSVIVGTESVVIVLLSAAFARRLPARRVLLAVLVTALGTAFVGSGEGGSASISGDLLVAAVAFSLYNWALSQVSTVAAGVSLTLIPVFGVVFSAALLSEPITLGTLAAAVAVIVGVVASIEPEPKQPAPIETATMVGQLSP